MIVLSDDDDDEGDVVMEESVIELSGDSSSEDECTSRVASQTRACKRSCTRSTGHGASHSPSPVDNRDLVHVIGSRSAYSHHFRTTIRYVTSKFRPPRGPTMGIDWFDKCIEELVRLITEGHDLDEIIGLTIASDLFLQGPGWFRVRSIRNFNYADLWQISGLIAQSNKALGVDETLQVVVSYSNQPVGSGDPDDNDTLKHCYRKSMIKITNEDNLCLPRAIVCAIEYLKNSKTKASRQEVRNKVNQQTRALELCEKAGVVSPDIGVARFIQRHPTHRFACLLCNRSYKASSSHKCTEKCEACISFNPCEPALYDVPCNDCNRVFVSQKCFDNHKRRGSYYNNSKNAITTVCDKIRICVDCYKQYDLMFDKHECGVSYCVDYRSKHNPNDQCYIRVKAPVRVRDPNAPDYHPDNQFICFDIESEQDEKFKDNPDPNKIQYKHIVCLLVAQLVCDFCRGNEDLTQSCPYYGAREIPYKKRDNPVRKFLELILHHPKKGFARRIVFAHSGGRYDVHSLLKELNENSIIQGSGVAPHVIMNGLQIKSVHIGNVVILDAHSFLTMELRAFPKAFGLADIKGFFPHKFSTKNNATYNDKWPAKEFYDPDDMSVSERAEFEEWYPSVCHGTFNLQAELLKYCKQDVTVLRQAILNFRDMFIEMTNVCPFTGPVTLTGAYTAAFMTTFMEDKVIGVIPARGYVRADEQSRKAIEYFTYPGEVHRVEIQHAGKGRERVLFDNIRVDGYIPGPPEVEIQFHGCLYHGCEQCNPHDRFVRLHDHKSLHQRYEDTQSISAKIRARGCILYEIWEHDFDKVIKPTQAFKNAILNHPTVQKLTLNPRHGLYGGRTGEFPVGHPRIYQGSARLELTGEFFGNFDKVNGMVVALVLPPDKLFHPLLPRKEHDKLILLHDPNTEVSRIEIMSEHVLYAWWKDEDHAVRPASNTNVVIALYVTDQARSKLYKYLGKLDKRVSYYDTDSIFATVSPSDDYVPPCGEYLGDWKNELEEYGPGAGIHTLVSGGPKCYAYRGKNDANETFE
ncbi:hypothetical protein QAD02_003650 [Eretmocerus hayati]|uniref:Uncharacterized protein n=1 Tax=Eretmocerus hayati TaxID=131215 RepID=A0ACC2NNB5_9HYME|nr:hypothetical protein QAD02_003650 [Eretmocerus hayati]